MKKQFSQIIEFHNGNKIPQIGYGTYQLQGEDCKNGVIIAVQKYIIWFIRSGYRHIDTASMYRNNIAIKAALKQLNVNREDIFITSKISTQEHGYESTIKSCKKNLAELETDYFDLLLIHWPGVAGLKPDDKKNASVRIETYKAMEELVKQGLVRNIGVSNFLKRHLEHLLSNVTIKPVVNQIEVHPLGWDVSTVQFCVEKNILVEAYSPLARQDPKLLQNPYLLELSKKYNKTVAQISLRWAFQKNFIVIPKSKREPFIVENFDIQDFDMNQQEIVQIDKLNCGLHTCWDPQVVKY